MRHDETSAASTAVGRAADLRLALERVTLGLALACLAYGCAAALVGGAATWTDGGPALYVLGAGLVFLLAFGFARRGLGGAASTCVGAGMSAVLAGLALRGEPWLGQLTACALGAVMARGLWSEHELRRDLDASRAAMRRLEEQLGHALRVGTVGDLAGLVAHGLRNKLQVIQGEAALGRGDPPGAKDVRLEAISAAILEAAALVDQLLDLAHPQAGDPARVDLDQHVAAFADKIAAVLPQEIRLRVERAPGPVLVVVDCGDLEHALLNLITNAKDAMRDGGDIHVAVRAEQRCAVLEVRDSGTGIEPALLDKVFEPYVTTKPRGQGTGLGLVAVRRFVEVAGGALRVESSVGHGSVFRVELPLHDAVPRGVAG